MLDAFRSRGWAPRFGEFTLLAVSCLAPWMFGSVESWAELVVDAMIGLAAMSALLGSKAPAGPGRRALGLPDLALGGLALLGLAQSLPLPEDWISALGPVDSEVRSEWMPDAPDRVPGDPGPLVPVPEPTLSLVPERSLHSAARLAMMWVLYRSVLQLSRGPGALRRFSVAISANSAVMALFALVQALTWNGRIFGIRPSPVQNAWDTGGPFVGHNPLAAYLNLGLGLGVGLLLSSPRSRRPWTVYTLGLVVVGLVASHSRSGLVAAIAAAAVLVPLLRRRASVLATLVVLGALVLAEGAVEALGASSPLQRLVSVFDSNSRVSRLEIARASLRAWPDHPLLGAGLGCFSEAVGPRFPTDHGVVFARAENEYLDLLVEGGIIGLGLGLLGFLSILRSGMAAFRSMDDSPDRMLVLGSLFGLVALAIQSLADFSPHILGIAVPSVVLCGYVRALEPERARQTSRPRYGMLVVPVLVSAVVLVHTWHRARAEAFLAACGLPPAESARPSALSPEISTSELQSMESALVAALRERPDWAEGHLRLGLVRVRLYEMTASRRLRDELGDSEQVDALSDVLWLHALAHSPGPEDLDAGDVASFEPVSRYLVPAARSFLEARRSNPACASAHAHLASLDFLLTGAGPDGTHLRRALRLSGPDRPLLEFVAELAAQTGDLPLAGRAWRRCLEVREADWEPVADSASLTLSPEQIMTRVLPSGPEWPIRFADRLYSGEKQRDSYILYCHETLRRLRLDHHMPLPERRRLEARARAGLGEDSEARTSWQAALDLEPTRSDWREEYASWLLATGDADEAHRQAVLGLRIDPGHPGLARIARETAETLARGGPSP